MPRKRREQQDGNLFCEGCHQWKHHTRFRRDRQNRHGTVPTFRRLCKACEQTERNEQKNEDRARAIVEGRAAERGRKSGVSKDFMLVEMNYRALIAPMRAMMSNEGLCLNCGHEFLNERDIQIEHRAPPRHPQDWARLHARNLWLACTACNASKGAKSYEFWLDEQESVRQSIAGRLAPDMPSQLALFA